mmetsp:Transcript_1671/g.5870  ORF Transcript_1671/g.5870 Transcript_1671/m.5870 type:complete len:139 (-) Transcript_1671:2398-2814(-)
MAAMAMTHRSVRFAVRQGTSTRQTSPCIAPAKATCLSCSFRHSAKKVAFSRTRSTSSSRFVASVVCSATAEEDSLSEAAPEPPADTVEGGKHYEICYLISSDHSADEAQVRSVILSAEGQSTPDANTWTLSQGREDSI